MKRPKKILTDIDGVVLKWVDAFDRYMVNQGYELATEIHSEHEKLHDRYCISHDEVWKHVEFFNSNQWQFGTLPPVDYAVETIKYLHGCGYTFVAITSCSDSSLAVALRKANLYNVFGPVFDEVHCIGVGEPKKDHLASHEPCFWIEDKPKNCLDGLDYGHLCILMDRPWNSNHIDDRYIRCYNWKEVAEVILENS